MKILFKVIILTILVFTTSCEQNESSSKYAINENHKVHYEVYGESENTLVFIHGWSSNGDVWKYQKDVFRDYKVIFVDLPGHGKSSKDYESEYTIELFAEAVKSVIDNEKAENVVLLGHSMGFAVAEVMVLMNPDNYKAICSIDGAHFEIPEDPEEEKEWIEFNRLMEESMNNEAGREGFINMLFLENTPQLLKEEILDSSKEVPLGIAKSMVKGVETDREYWRDNVIDIPCLAVYSPAYQLPNDYESEFKKSFPDLTYHNVENVSHFFMLEIPYRTNQIIQDFCSELF